MDIAKLVESETSYRREVREAARGYWSGVITFGQFFDSMLSTIDRGLTRAWHKGLKECDIRPEEMTADERAELQRRITSENSFLGGFATFIEANSKANGGKLGTVFGRADLWVMRYRNTLNHAKLLACEDKKLKWSWQPGKEHCKTCSRLHGRVYRASVWRSNGVEPQEPPNNKLECGGWHCGCSLDPTSDRVTPGPFPSTP